MSTSPRDPHEVDPDQLQNDPKLRRRIQNRNAQRNTRLRRAAQKQKASAQVAHHTHRRCCCQHQTPPAEPEEVVSSMVRDACSNLQQIEAALMTPKTVKSPSAPQTMTIGMNQDSQLYMEIFGSPTAHLQDSFLGAPGGLLIRQDVASEPVDGDVSLALLDPRLTALDAAQPLAETGTNRDVITHSTSGKEGGMSSEDPHPGPDSRETEVPKRQGKAASPSSQRKTPLHVCAATGNHKILEILIRGGAEVDAADEAGRSALHHSAEKGHREVVRILLEHEADPSLIDNQGISALHLAVANNQESIVVLLLELGFIQMKPGSAPHPDMRPS
ncbi:Ankyrin repeat domain-containing protein 39 [Cladobotryum mycophilum]|uniref:Ankyrin repeat domain-containing protein 39 n=1 Tax=Cladobotryum mycophilum TaxID=491253 RepID=A0ABR0SQY9_9HYPO